METMDPLSQNGNWQFYLGLLGHMHQDTNQEKEQGRNMRGNAKTICPEWGFICCWYNRVLLVILESSLPPMTTLKRRNSKPLSHC